MAETNGIAALSGEHEHRATFISREFTRYLAVAEFALKWLKAWYAPSSRKLHSARTAMPRYEDLRQDELRRLTYAYIAGVNATFLLAWLSGMMMMQTAILLGFWISLILLLYHRLEAGTMKGYLAKVHEGLFQTFRGFAQGVILSLMAITGIAFGVAGVAVVCGCLGWCCLAVAGQLLLLPGFRLQFTTQMWRLERQGIHHTCPTPTCSYRGEPACVCGACGKVVQQLRPSLRGLWAHPCPVCGTLLPTLEGRGREQLARRCGVDERHVLGAHAGQAPERLIGIVGGPGSGKTSYLLMAVAECIGATGIQERRIRAQIDVAGNEDQFAQDWMKLQKGIPVAKTDEIPPAFLLHGTVDDVASEVYLYDAPGKDFTSISSMTRQHYLPLLEGMIILVDPFSFGAMCTAMHAPARKNPHTLQEVVNSVLSLVSASVGRGTHGRIPMRVAVVLAKADLWPITRAVGDIRHMAIPRRKCREALLRLGARPLLRVLDHQFQAVEYFACSALGREVDSKNSTAFCASGVLEPLAWVLTGVRRDGTQQWERP